LVGLADAHDLGDARELLEERGLELGGADHGDHRPLLAFDEHGARPRALHAVLDGHQLVVAEALLEHDDHKSPQIRASFWKKCNAKVGRRGVRYFSPANFLNSASAASCSSSPFFRA